MNKRRQGILAAEFALVGVLVGLAAGVLFAWPAPRDGQAAMAYGNNVVSDAPKDGPAARGRTAYVDFIKLLKQEPKFLNEQWGAMVLLEADMRREVQAFEARREADMKELRAKLVTQKEYRDTMNQAITNTADSLLRRMRLESGTQRDIDDMAQEAFGRVKNLVAEISTARGYSQVLVIANVAAKDVTFEKLQQQLLMSPVLIYPQEDDITAIVEKEMLRRSNGYLLIGVDENSDEGIHVLKGGVKTTRMAKDKDKNPDDVWFEVKLGDKLQFGAEVTDLDENDKRVPAAGDKAEVEWLLPRLNTGSIDGKTGLYAAPETLPEAGAIINVRVAPRKHTYRFKTVRVRLLPK